MIPRRAFLGGCAACAVGCAPAPPPPPLDTAPTCPEGEESVDGWFEVPLADHPGLELPGGTALVDDDATLLHIILAHRDPGCFVAIWRICTHGACELEWDGSLDAAVCPCHGSIFGEDGAVLQGPAETPVRAFRALRRGDSVFIER